MSRCVGSSPTSSAKFNTKGTRMSRITPIQDRIVVKRKTEDSITSGGIVLTGSAVEKSFEGTVLAVGPGKYDDKGKLQPMHLVAGDTILFGKFAGTEVTVDEEKFLIMREEDILGILR